jgi:hypothetical protein
MPPISRTRACCRSGSVIPLVDLDVSNNAAIGTAGIQALFGTGTDASASTGASVGASVGAGAGAGAGASAGASADAVSTPGAYVATFPALKSLGFSACNVDDEGARCVALRCAQVLPALRVLDLSKNKVTCVGAAALAPLSTHLHSLRLSGNVIADEGAWFAAVQHFTPHSRRNLCHTR